MRTGSKPFRSCHLVLSPAAESRPHRRKKPDMDQGETSMITYTTTAALERALEKHQIDPSAFEKGEAKNSNSNY